jgi:hypothetical protein
MNANKSASSHHVMPQSATVNPPSPIEFTGKIVRFEADGFGIIEFDNPIGPSANAQGIVTSSSTALSPLTSIRAGAKVEGTAEADERNFASIKTFKLIEPST